MKNSFIIGIVWVAVKTFIVSFGATVYFLDNNSTENKMKNPLTNRICFAIIYGRTKVWCSSQVVRPRSATPSSPVQIRLTPLLETSINYRGFLFTIKRDSQKYGFGI